MDSEIFPERNHPGTNKDFQTKYVLAGQPTGWAAMAREVRDFDEEKVRSSKEDVDTLLVFAGLFSAVLSAFLVASYPNLQPSPMVVMNYTLERIATQTVSYNYTDGKLISTTTLPALPPFQASAEDIRVNVLWFASLTLSLMTASFGMLVKQWLREFLAVEVPSPQARLRIRHFREPQILQWRVYEIVACLPLLLQLSLALFFLGLCYFASSVHASVGHTTIPLVVGWAFCFFGATALPIFFPRCPYQTTLLKTVVALFHRCIRRLAARIESECSIALGAIQQIYLAEYMRRGFTYTTFEEWFGRRKRTLHDRWLMVLERICQHFIAYFPDEQLLVENTFFDVDILIAVDAIQADDDLLGTTIREALQYIRPDPSDAILFVMQILAHRLPPTTQHESIIPDWPFDSFPMRSLRPTAKTSIMNILSDYIERIDPKYSILQPEDVAATNMRTTEKLLSARVSARCLLVISALTTEDVFCIHPDIIRAHLHSCAENVECELIVRALMSNTDPSNEENFWGDMTGLMRTLLNTWTVANAGFEAGAQFFEAIQTELANVQRRPRQFDWLSWEWSEDAPADFQSASLSFICLIVSTELYHLPSEPQVDENDIRAEEGEEDGRSQPPAKEGMAQQRSLKNAFACALRLFRTRCFEDWSSDVLVRVQDMLVLAIDNEQSTRLLVEVLDCPLPQEDSDNLNLPLLGLPSLYNVRSKSTKPSKPVTEKDLDVLSSIAVRKLSESSTANNLSHSLRLCYHLIYLLLVIDARSAGLERCRGLWSYIASTVLYPLLGVQGHHELQPQDHPEPQGEHVENVARLAYACLTLIECEYGKTVWYGNWAHEYQAHDTIFPGDFIETLIRLTSPKDRWGLWHLRELQEERAMTEWSTRQNLRTWESHYNWSDCGDGTMEDDSGDSSGSRSLLLEASLSDVLPPTTQSHDDELGPSESPVLDANGTTLPVDSRQGSITTIKEDDDGHMGDDEGGEEVISVADQNAADTGQAEGSKTLP